MTSFLSTELVSKCFKRLSARERGGKKHLERTSALLYFLAFDATCKFFEVDTLDFTPETLLGKNHRRQFELEFVRLAVLERNQDKLKQVTEFGKIDVNGTVPEQRISSNFFSVPVKKASTRPDQALYPNRPKAPVLSMGVFATDKPWGVTLYEKWQTNLPKLLSEIKHPTPNIDLAIFAVRDMPLRTEYNDVLEAISDSLKNKFTKHLCDYFSSRFEKEKVFCNHLDKPFSDHYSLFSHNYQAEIPSGEASYKSMKKEEMIQRIIYLEEILEKNGIEY